MTTSTDNGRTDLNSHEFDSATPNVSFSLSAARNAIKGWSELPVEIQVMILKVFCQSLADNFKEYPKNFAKMSNPSSVAKKTPIPPAFTSYMSALLTCRAFHDYITREIQITFFEHTDSPGLALQRLQNDELIDWGRRVVRGWAFCGMVQAKAMLGRFWKNRARVFKDYDTFDNLFARLKRTDCLILACLIGDMLEECKTPARLDLLYPPLEYGYIREAKQSVNRSFHGLAFKPGAYHLGQRKHSMSWNTVLDCQSANFPDVSDDGRSESEDDERVTLFGCPKGLPNIAACEPDTWWLGRHMMVNGGYQYWYLVNYKEKKVFVGPTGLCVEWGENFNGDNLDLWNITVLERGYFLAPNEL
jgi:hypothetical protein